MSKDIICNCENCQLQSLFFAHVTKDVLEDICVHKIERQHSKGETIIQQGDPIKEFIYLKSGLVKLIRTTSENKDQIISFSKPFDFVSVFSVFSSEYYNYSVIAIDDSITCILDLEEVKRHALNNGHFAMDLMYRMSTATDHIIIDNMEIRKKQLKGRIAHILLYFARNIYKANNFELPVSRREIAEYIGMTVENVIRTLSEFRKDGLIKIYGKEILILNEKLLEEVSEHG